MPQLIKNLANYKGFLSLLVRSKPAVLREDADFSNEFSSLLLSYAAPCVVDKRLRKRSPKRLLGSNFDSGD
jgi:hypothetical protein